jgi:DNA-binding PadR family transcriptional regulator
MKQPRMSPHTFRLLEVFASEPESWRYGYDLSRETSLMSGTLYPLLMRLTKHGLLESRWVTTVEGTPPRHMYRLTAKGVTFASQRLAEVSPARSRRPALQKGPA